MWHFHNGSRGRRSSCLREGCVCGDATVSFGRSPGPCHVIHFPSSPVLVSPFLLVRAASVALTCLKLNTRLEVNALYSKGYFLLWTYTFCLCLYLPLNSNISLWTCFSQPRRKLKWFGILVSRLTHNFASSYKCLNSASPGAEFVLPQISVCRAVYGVNAVCRGFGCL